MKVKKRGVESWRGATTKTRQGHAAPNQESLFGWSSDFASYLRAAYSGGGRGEVQVFDFSSLVDVDPAELASAVAAIQTELRREGADRWIGVRWDRARSRTHYLRSAFTLAWETLSRSRKAMILPLLDRDELELVGRLPASLTPDRVALLTAHRTFTYHRLATNDGRNAKGLGKLLPEYASLGLVAPRGYATKDDLLELGIADLVHDRARPQIWESLPAAMLGVL